VIVGRDAELSRLAETLADAAVGSSRALAVIGAPGMGKTTLLDAAAAGAHGMCVIRFTGAEAERDVPFAGLLSILRPLLDEADALTDAQRAAVSTVLGESEGPSPGRLLTGVAVLGLLAARAERVPVVVLVDDLQWVDRPSAEALVFAARRLRAERVAIVVSARAPTADSDVPSDELLRALDRMEIDALDPAAAHRLLREHGVARRVTERLLELTGGNPLALLEVTAQLNPRQRSGNSPLPDQLPSSRPERGYERTLSSFDANPRAAVRLAALAGRAPREVVARALGNVGLRLEDLTPLEASGLGRLGPEGMTWRHPLVRNAAAQGTTAELRSLHRSLAAAWAGRPESTAARAWHLARGATEPDETAADALAVAAGLNEQRGAILYAADA